MPACSRAAFPWGSRRSDICVYGPSRQSVLHSVLCCSHWTRRTSDIQGTLPGIPSHCPRPALTNTCRCARRPGNVVRLISTPHCFQSCYYQIIVFQNKSSPHSLLYTNLKYSFSCYSVDKQKNFCKSLKFLK